MVAGLAAAGAAVSLKRWISRPASIQIRPRKDTGTQEIGAGTPVSVDSEIRLRSFLDVGEQNIETKGPLIMDEREKRK